MPAISGQRAEYDLIVLGAGPGGYSAALEAARLGARVALVERDEPGGTCLHRGCIPAKTMYEASRHCEPFHEATERRYRVIQELHGQLLKLLAHPKITLIRGEGFIEGPSRVRVTQGGNVQSVEAPRLVVATGSVPIMPDGLPPVGLKMDSDGATFLETLPARAVVVGGGYTGCEYAGILNTYGVPVTIVELGEHLLMTEDADIVAELTASFTARGIDVRTRTSLDDVELRPTDLLLVTVGRTPESSGVGLEQLGVRFGRRNGLVVNERMESGVPGVYAIGDVLDAKWRFAHVAEAEAKVAVRNALGQDARADYRVVPSTIFTDPLVMSVGARESDLNREDYVVGKALFRHNSMANCSGDTRGFVKILVERGAPHRILGAAAVGQDIEIHQMAMAMASGATVHDVAEMIHFHPSRGEAVKQAAEAAARRLEAEARRAVR